MDRNERDLPHLRDLSQDVFVGRCQLVQLLTGQLHLLFQVLLLLPQLLQLLSQLLELTLLVLKDE